MYSTDLFESFQSCQQVVVKVFLLGSSLFPPPYQPSRRKLVVMLLVVNQLEMSS